MRLFKTTAVGGFFLAIMLCASGKACAQEVYAFEEKPVTVQLRTNGLYWLGLSPNIGAEVQTDMGLAFQLDYMGAWWNCFRKHKFWSNYAFHAEARYYLGAKKQENPYKGHHIGVYAILATYDFEFGNTGYQSNDLSKTWSIGATYGWTKPLNRHLSLDFTLGLGFLQSTYDVYIPQNDKYIRMNTKRMRFFGPTKVEVSLVWNINNKNNK